LEQKIEQNYNEAQSVKSLQNICDKTKEIRKIDRFF
jgi:hypothetical protein